ncbi:hypothetical protein DPMN_075568 [Dreissena polymorpha]|uniref:Uncharacterized protein n=1 Tax=Dreissena polymorpha TaxID=45954 RepID=A0A9D3YH93_DREPO|nr:hypothetical protein DPMN_075568 [Dreissena polymorpha]
MEVDVTEAAVATVVVESSEEDRVEAAAVERGKQTGSIDDRAFKVNITPGGIERQKGGCGCYLHYCDDLGVLGVRVGLQRVDRDGVLCWEGVGYCR